MAQIPPEHDKAEGDRDKVTPDARGTHVSDSAQAEAQDTAGRSNLRKDPDEWKTGDETMTDAQRSYLETLCRETGEEFDETLSKADASKRIDELRGRSPRLAQD